jgi:secondary thiamine-phosphate synthase enzyme
MNSTGEHYALENPGKVVPDGIDLIARADRRLGFVDLTDSLETSLSRAGIWDGACIAFSRHTTCALMINEWEDGALEDLRDRVQALIPLDDYYAHDDHTRRTQNLMPAERRNGHAHVAQMLMGGTSLAIPVRRGRLLLGRWQRVILMELDHPKDRSIALQFLPSAVRSQPVRRVESFPAQAS